MFITATPDAGEDPKVTRAKFFIRDEFLVSIGDFFNFELTYKFV